MTTNSQSILPKFLKSHRGLMHIKSRKEQSGFSSNILHNSYDGVGRQGEEAIQSTPQYVQKELCTEQTPPARMR